MDGLENTNQPVVPANSESDVQIQGAGNTATPDFNSMSDEDIMNFDPTSLLDELEGKGTSTTIPAENKEAGIGATEENNEPEKKVEQNLSVDAQSFVDAITAPIKAGGKEIKLNSPEEVIRLVQMGVDYSRKMESINKDAPLVQALKDAGLFTAENINRAIDVISGKPEAIKALVAQHKLEIDPLAEEVPEYTPDNHVPDEAIIKWQNTAADIAAIDGNNDFLNAVNGSFDDDSKRILLSNPQYFRDLHANKQSGAYDAIMAEYEKRKLIADPTIAGLNSLQAYVVIGDMLFKNSGQGDNNTSAQPERQEAKVPVGSRPATTQSAPTKAAPPVPAGVKQPKQVAPTPADTAPVDLSRLTDEQIIAMESQFL